MAGHDTNSVVSNVLPNVEHVCLIDHDDMRSGQMAADTEQLNK
jgi:hypothetical protein